MSGQVIDVSIGTSQYPSWRLWCTSVFHCLFSSYHAIASSRSACVLRSLICAKLHIPKSGLPFKVRVMR